MALLFDGLPAVSLGANEGGTDRDPGLDGQARYQVLVRVFASQTYAASTALDYQWSAYPDPSFEGYDVRLVNRAQLSMAVGHQAIFGDSGRPTTFTFELSNLDSGLDDVVVKGALVDKPIRVFIAPYSESSYAAGTQTLRDVFCGIVTSVAAQGSNVVVTAEDTLSAGADSSAPSLAFGNSRYHNVGTVGNSATSLADALNLDYALNIEAAFSSSYVNEVRDKGVVLSDVASPPEFTFTGNEIRLANNPAGQITADTEYAQAFTVQLGVGSSSTDLTGKVSLTATYLAFRVADLVNTEPFWGTGYYDTVNYATSAQPNESSVGAQLEPGDKYFPPLEAFFESSISGFYGRGTLNTEQTVAGIAHLATHVYSTGFGDITTAQDDEASASHVEHGNFSLSVAAVGGTDDTVYLEPPQISRVIRAKDAVIVEYQDNYTVQTGDDLATSVSEEDKEVYNKLRKQVQVDATNAPGTGLTSTVSTQLSSLADAQVVGQYLVDQLENRTALYRVRGTLELAKYFPLSAITIASQDANGTRLGVIRDTNGKPILDTEDFQILSTLRIQIKEYQADFLNGDVTLIGWGLA